MIPGPSGGPALPCERAGGSAGRDGPTCSSPATAASTATGSRPCSRTSRRSATRFGSTSSSPGSAVVGRDPRPHPDVRRVPVPRQPGVGRFRGLPGRVRLRPGPRPHRHPDRARVDEPCPAAVGARPTPAGELLRGQPRRADGAQPGPRPTGSRSAVARPAAGAAAAAGRVLQPRPRRDRHRRRADPGTAARRPPPPAGASRRRFERRDPHPAGDVPPARRPVRDGCRGGRRAARRGERRRRRRSRRRRRRRTAVDEAGPTTCSAG